jgi:hypothetical protein
VSRDPEEAVATIDRLCAADSQQAYLELVGETALAETRNWQEQA